MTKLPVSWKEGHTLRPIVAFAPLESLLSVFSTLPFLPILSITWFVLLKPPSFPSQFAIQLGKARAPWPPCFIILNIPICPVTHTCTFLLFFPVFSFFLSRQPCLSSQLLVTHPPTRAVTWPLCFPPSFSLLCSKCSR